MPVQYRTEASVEYGVLVEVAPNVRRIVARNPSPFTYHGTGTFVIGRGNVMVVDPGPLLQAHVDALLDGLGEERISHVLVTHTHNDHSPATRLLTERLSTQGRAVRSYGFGAHGEGRYGGGAEIEEGADRDFVPDVRVKDREIIEGDGFSIECVHTPGHAQNHVCFALREERVLLSGDHVMGWATTVVSPPDGDMGDYFASLSRLLERDDALYLPTHGRSIDEPKAFVESLIDHRKERERQVLACVAQGVERIDAMVARMYTDVPTWLHPAAARSVFAHVLLLREQGIVTCDGEPTLDARYQL